LLLASSEATMDAPRSARPNPSARMAAACLSKPAGNGCFRHGEMDFKGLIRI
jgi:hypothetical protein